MGYLRRNWKELLGAQAGVALLALGILTGLASTFVPHIFGSDILRWDEIFGRILVAWLLFPFWCPMLEKGMWVYIAMLMSKGWVLGYGFVASYRSGARESDRFPAIVYWYALTNGLASIFLIVYGLAMGIVPLLAGNILMIFAFVLLGSLATTVLGLAIAFTFVWLLRKLLQTPDEPKQNNELPPQS
jgi:hypothetical protein